MHTLVLITYKSTLANSLDYKNN